MISSTNKYWNVTICENGHVLDPGYSNTQKFCEQCGSSVVSNCKHCNNPIRGAKVVIGGYIGDLEFINDPCIEDFKISYYCPFCSKPYPWTEKIFTNITEILSLDGDINSDTKSLIITALPDLIVETPNTQLAVAKFNTSYSKLNDVIKSGVKNILFSLISEVIKRQIFPGV